MPAFPAVPVRSHVAHNDIHTVFLTLEDPRARVKGSRDPLGFQPVWSGFGRRIVANLTTVTNSVRGFTVLLLGRYLGNRLLEDGRIGEEDLVDAFLRTEQICGYARYLAMEEGTESEGRILGIERIKRRLSEGKSSIRIDATAYATILSDQKTYGLWGLFSVSARASKLVPDGPIGVAPEAAEFINRHYTPTLSSVLDRLLQLVAGGGKLRVSPAGSVAGALGEILGGPLSAAERSFYREYLCDAQHCQTATSGRQARFRELLEHHTDLTGNINRAELDRIERAARENDAGLARRIGRILALEALLAPCDVIFGLLQTRHGQRPADIAETLGDRWGPTLPHLGEADFSDIQAEIADSVGEEVTTCMALTNAGLRRGDYETSIDQLLRWNELVMSRRHAAPWIRLDDLGALDVRYRGTERRLPSAEAMPSLWRNSYFIDALKALTAQTQVAEDQATR